MKRVSVACLAALVALTPVTRVFADDEPSGVDSQSISLATTAQGVELTFSYTDPVGDNIGAIDVTGMVVVYDNATGNYTITLTATDAKPFVGQFRVNINLYNPDTAPSNSLFQDVVRDFDLATATPSLTLTGTKTNLLAWRVGDRVATNTLAGLGNPPGSSFFRASVLNFPFGYLTNEDAIAFGPTGVTTIRFLHPRDAVQLLMDGVEALLVAGTLTQDQADGLMDKLEASLANLDQGNLRAVCNQLAAFLNQVDGFISAGVLPPEEGQDLLDVTEVMRDQIGC